jgi:ABC-2 type transport system permease protein
MPVVDQGYQHWTGELSGHAGRWLAITRRGVKTALRLRLVRFALLIAWIPAIVLVFVLCMWGLVERQSDTVKAILPFLTSILGQPIVAGPREFRVEIWTICFHFFLWWELWFAMLLVLLVGPNLISQDLRYNALPLYLSRPLRRIDYFAGKLGIIVSILGITIIGPTCIAYALGLLFSLDISIVRDTWRILAGSVIYGLVIAVSAGMLMLALSSLSRNSRYVVLLWIGLWLITSTVSAVLANIELHRRMHATSFRPHIWSDEQFLAGEMEAAKTDWRPLISYTSNLQRIEERLLGSNASWKRLSELSPKSARGQFLWRILGTQYPWYWSAGVLVGILAVSACILHFSVKSLDQLK